MLQVAGIFSDSMVLQQGKPVPVWGTAEPDEKIVVKFMGGNYETVVENDGSWQVALNPLTASFNPERMEICTKREQIIFEDILIGEVWLCSGQSNMEFPIHQDEKAKDMIKAADFPHIRFFMVPRSTAGVPQKDIGRTLHIFDGHWELCKPVVTQFFSAVGYYFGLELYKKLNVPIGLINASIGCTGIETWTSPDAFAANHLFKEHIDIINEAHEKYRKELELCLPDIKKLISGESNEIPANMPVHPLSHWSKETGLYNGMIAPLAPYALRGVLWYQGESNCKDGIRYADKMKALVNGWRQKWDDELLPFYQVQIAPCNTYNPGELPNLWLGQYKASEEIQNCFMISTIDVADIRDIHPKRKYPVGQRLAMSALVETYGRKGIEHKSPSYENLIIESDKVRILFKNVGQKGLYSRDGKPLSWFEIAGQNAKYHKASAVIDGKTVVAWSPKVKAPKSVRFAWSCVASPNLSGKNNLPVLPFITK